MGSGGLARITKPVIRTMQHHNTTDLYHDGTSASLFEYSARTDIWYNTWGIYLHLTVLVEGLVR